MPGAVVAEVGSAAGVVRLEALGAIRLISTPAVGGRRGVNLVVAVVIRIRPIAISVPAVIRRCQRAADDGAGGEAQPDAGAAPAAAMVPAASPRGRGRRRNGQYGRQRGNRCDCRFTILHNLLRNVPMQPLGL